MEVRLLQWNAGGLKTKYRELKQLVWTQNYDVICVQETFLKTSDVAKWDIHGYTAVRRDRPSPALGGGLVTYVRNCLTYLAIDGPKDIECQGVSISTMTGQMTVYNVYLPPGGELAQGELSAFDHLLDGDKVIVVGDLNAKSTLWRSPVNDARGRQLEKVISDRDFVALNAGTPTRLHRTGSVSHIDVSLASSSLALKCRWSVVNSSMGSDHNPILILVNERPTRDFAVVPRWKVKAANWKAFANECSVRVQIETVFDDDVDRFNENVTEAIVGAALASVPQTGDRRGKRIKPLPFWNDEIRAAVYARNRARNKMSRSQDIDDCIEYRRLRSVAQRVIRDSAIRHWREYCSTLNSNSRLSTV